MKTSRCGRMLPYKNEYGRILIAKRAIWKWLILLVMLLPDGAFQLFPIYTSETPSDISYKWLNYKFGILSFLILLACVFYAMKKREKWIGILFLAMILRELGVCIFTPNNIFFCGRYEMYLSLFMGLLLAVAAKNICDNQDDYVEFFSLLLFSNIATIFFSILVKPSGLHGRYNITNMDVGTSGWLCCIALLFTIIERKNWRGIWIGVFCTVALFLSGSRTNFLITLVAVLGLLLWRRVRNKSIKKNTMIVVSFLSVAFVAGLVWLLCSQTGQTLVDNVILDSRLIKALNVSEVKSDGSFRGRSSSLTAGFGILKDNPLGISGYFINLQRETRARGFSTFPHCGALDAYLIFGPIVILLFAFWIKVLINLFKKKSEYFFLLFSLVLYQIVAGGAIVNFKIYTFYALLTFLVYDTSKVEKTAWVTKEGENLCDTKLSN